MTKIKPCPFCGSEGELGLYTLNDDEGRTKKDILEHKRKRNE